MKYNSSQPLSNQSQSLLCQKNFLFAAGVFSINIRQFDTLLPWFFGGHFAAKKFHHNIHPLDIVSNIISQICANAKKFAPIRSPQ